MPSEQEGAANITRRSNGPAVSGGSGPNLALGMRVQPVRENVMRKLLAIGGAAALALSAMAASADELTGTISNIDLNRNTFQLEGKTFTASPTNTVGAKLTDLMEGDKVTVEAAEIETGKQPINVMRLEKTE